MKYLATAVLTYSIFANLLSAQSDENALTTKSDQVTQDGQEQQTGQEPLASQESQTSQDQNDSPTLSIVPRLYGQALGAFSLDASTPNPMVVPLIGEMTADFGVESTGEFWATKAIMELSLQELKPSLKPKDVWVEFDVDKAFFFRIGWYRQDLSALDLFPVTNYLQAIAATRFLETAGSAVADADLMAGFKVVIGGFSVDLTIAPFQPKWDIPNLESPWFPPNDNLKRMDLGAFLGTYTQHDFSVADVGWKDFAFDTYPSAALKISWQNSLFDLHAIAFVGTDRQAVFPATVTLPAALPGVFDILLTPSRNYIFATALSAGFAISDLRVVAEFSTTWNKLLVSKELSLVHLTALQSVSSATVGDLGFETSWKMPWVPVTLIAGGRVFFNFWSDASVDAPEFSNLGAFGFSVDLFEKKLNISPLAILSWKDWSGLILMKLQWELLDGQNLWLSVPLFWGVPTTEWGQFSGRYSLQIGVSWDL